nr:uncharacterized protein LOC129273079 isoform X2 [Lytechinus pictus]
MKGKRRRRKKKGKVKLKTRSSLPRVQPTAPSPFLPSYWIRRAMNCAPCLPKAWLSSFSPDASPAPSCSPVSCCSGTTRPPRKISISGPVSELSSRYTRLQEGSTRSVGRRLSC